VNKKLKLEIYKKTWGNCAYCGKFYFLFNRWVIEHIEPKSKGGKDDLDNLILSCPSCNTKKNNRNPVEFKQYISEMAMDYFYTMMNNKYVSYALLSMMSKDDAMMAVGKIQTIIEKCFSIDNLNFYFERHKDGEEDLD